MTICNPFALKSSFTTRLPGSAAAGDGLRRRSAASGSGSATSTGERLVLVSTITLSLSLSLLVALSVPARVSPSCLSFAEARAAFPGKHLWWHGHRERCWDANGGRTAVVKSHSKPLSPSAPSSPDTTPMLLYPTLVKGDGIDDAALLDASAMTSWPILLDIDEITSDAPEPQDECCWPALAALEPPFADRWAALPSTWFFSALRMELTP